MQGVHDDSLDKQHGVVIRNGKEIVLQAFNWESHKHDWWRNLETKVPDIAKVWLHNSMATTCNRFLCASRLSSTKSLFTQLCIRI
ncbi:alpha-amylase [Ranunculus cassubicifolius]